MENGNAARFLKSYNNIESRLKILYSARPTQNFTDLVKRCTDLNITVRRYENELVDYGKLRNAIVHSTAGGELFIANPCDEVVDSIESIEKQICVFSGGNILAHIGSFDVHIQNLVAAVCPYFIGREPGSPLLAAYKILTEIASVCAVHLDPFPKQAVV